MPRNPGTGVYTKPSPDVITGTTIESTVYNTFVGDVETDLNLPRPVSSGGTGATSADGVLVNVSGEKAAQLVADYNTHVWFPGSFRSAAAAAGAPNATSSFVGTAYINEALANPPTNQNVVLEARDQNDTGFVPGRTYVREKKAGVWSAWTGGIYAAPLDALAYNGMQVNGTGQVSQEKGTGTTSANVGYICDGWKLYWAGTMVLSAGMSVTSLVPGIPAHIYVNVTTAQASLGASDTSFIAHHIEGYRVARLAWGTASARPITIGFWSGHFRTGLYSVSVRNSGTNRSYATSYTQNASNVMQFNTITIPGDTTGTWLSDNSTGLFVSFALASGTTDTTASPNTWQAESKASAPGQVNGVGATSDVFRITGVVVIPGTLTIIAAQSPLIMRPYDQELVLCQRYYNQIVGASPAPFVASGVCYNTITALVGLTFPQMRTKPTFTSSTPSTTFNIFAGNTTSAVSTLTASTSQNAARLDCAVTGMTIGHGAALSAGPGAFLAFDARL